VKISVEALQAPTKDSLDAWLNTPRLAKCGEVFTPAEPMWKPDRSAGNSLNWEAAIACVSPEWKPWLHAVLAYRMADQEAGSVNLVASVLSRAAQAGIDPLNEGQLIDLRARLIPSFSLQASTSNGQVSFGPDHSSISLMMRFSSFGVKCPIVNPRSHPAKPRRHPTMATPLASGYLQ